MATYKIVFATASKKTELCRIYLKITIKRVPKQINLLDSGLFWHKDFLDKENETVKRMPKKYKGKKLLSFIETQKVIIDALDKVKKIIDSHQRTKLTHEIFKKRFLEERLEQKNKADVFFALHFQKEKCKNRQLSQDMVSKYENAITHLSRFNSKIGFSDLSEVELDKFVNYLSNEKKYAANTVINNLTYIKTLAKTARTKGKFNVHADIAEYQTKLQRKFNNRGLTKNEINVFYNYYQSDKIISSEKIVLKEFLFACFTSLRFSDVKSFNPDFINLTEKYIEFTPHKGRKKKPSPIQIPLTESALKFLPRGEGFGNWYTNKLLKGIATKLKIYKPNEVTFHLSRHTFAYTFADNGGTPDVLQILMNHSDISTTMRYYEVSQKQKNKQIQLTDLLKDDPPKIEKPKFDSNASPSNFMKIIEIRAKIDVLKEMEKRRNIDFQAEITELEQNLYQFLS